MTALVFNDYLELTAMERLGFVICSIKDAF